VRAIALFEAFGGFDRQYIGERAVSNARASAHAAHHKKSSHSVGPGGTGYGTGSTGYNHYSESHSHRSAKHSASNHQAALAAHWEDIIVRAIKTVTIYLPAPYADGALPYDMLPHRSIQALFTFSQLADLLGDLLRNDSVTDWTGPRGETYAGVLGLLKRMADCELTIRVLVQERWVRTDRTVGIEEWMWGEADIVWEREAGEGGKEPGDFARSPPLYDCFKKLTRQCEAFLGSVVHMMESGQDGEDMQATVQAAALCGDMIAARDDIDRAMVVLGTSAHPAKGKGKARDPRLEMEDAYARDCERLAFRHVALSEERSDRLAYPTFYYSNEVASTASATRNPKDRLRLVKELSTMSTSLPPGVWLRVDEVRNDVMCVGLQEMRPRLWLTSSSEKS
jgi:hypothetical protein